jgi:hypothetical protein
MQMPEIVATGLVDKDMSTAYPNKENISIGINIRHVVSRNVPTISAWFSVEDFGCDDFLSALMYTSTVP